MARKPLYRLSRWCKLQTVLIYPPTNRPKRATNHQRTCIAQTAVAYDSATSSSSQLTRQAVAAAGTRRRLRSSMRLPGGWELDWPQVGGSDCQTAAAQPSPTHDCRIPRAWERPLNKPPGRPRSPLVDSTSSHSWKTVVSRKVLSREYELDSAHTLCDSGFDNSGWWGCLLLRAAATRPGFPSNHHRWPLHHCPIQVENSHLCGHDTGGPSTSSCIRMRALHAPWNSSPTAAGTGRSGGERGRIAWRRGGLHGRHLAAVEAHAAADDGARCCFFAAGRGLSTC
jgi:hypothetical protein